MCDPVVGAAVLTTAMSAGQVAAQIKSAKAQTKAIREQQAVSLRENQQATSAEVFDQMRATRREQGRIRAAAGEAGLALSSGSVEALLEDSAMQGDLQRQRSLANLESRNTATTAQAASMLSQVQKPTALGASLQIGSSALSGWSSVQSAKLKRQGAAPSK